MRRKALVSLVVLAMAACTLALNLRSMLRGEQVPAPPPTPTTVPAEHYMGVGSCASPACHGGPATPANDRTRGKWNSSYTVWVERDKHAQAYSVLYEERSKAIARNLHLDKEPYREPRCLACHATVGEVSNDGRAIEADGVGCEACHGPARSWLADHYARDWSANDPRMVHTRDVAVRAGVCVEMSRSARPAPTACLRADHGPRHDRRRPSRG